MDYACNHRMQCNGMAYAWAYMVLRNGLCLHSSNAVQRNGLHLGLHGVTEWILPAFIECSITEWIMPGLTWRYGMVYTSNAV